MDIRGLEKTTLLDYPGKVACTVFVSGCNFRCPFCYNRDLVLDPTGLERLSEEGLFRFLGKRRKILDAVVVCGGEPILQKGLEQFLGRIKRMGFLTKLDTNGSRPDILENLLKEGLLDFVSLDVKAPFEEKAYAAATGLSDFEEKVGIAPILRSIKVLFESGIEVEFRTTVVPGLHDKEDLIRLATQLRDLLVSCHSELVSESVKKRDRTLKQVQGDDQRKFPFWYLQQFEPRTCLDPSFTKIKPFSKLELEEILAAVRRVYPPAELRGV